MQGSSSRTEAFTGAHDFEINGDVRFTQAQNAYFSNHSHHYGTNTGAVDLAKILNPIHDASHTRNRKTAPPESQCLAGTRQDVFQQLGSWVQSGDLVVRTVAAMPPTQTKAVCWMHGPVGCGKSAIAQSMAEEYASRGRLAASFFFFRGAGRRSTADGFATTLAHQIALKVPGAKQFIETAIVQDPGIVSSSSPVDRQIYDLVYQPLLRCTERLAYDDPYLIVIDGADECGDKETISSFIDGAITFFSRHPQIPLRILITSRVEEHIQTHVEDGSAVVHLFDLSSRSNSADVELAMRATFEHAKKYDLALRSYGPLWPNQTDIDTLVRHCEGSFIFASTISKFILRGSGNDDPRTPMDRLGLALHINPGIDAVYAEVLSRAKSLPHFNPIISILVYLESARSISFIAALLGLSAYEVIRVLVTLQAIIQVPGRDDSPVTFFHTSLRDFLLNETRAGEFYCPASPHHFNLFDRCIDVLVGTEPTSNTECCVYALKYVRAHHRDMDKPYGAFGMDGPYKPVDRGEWTSRNCTSRRGERRPITFKFPIRISQSALRLPDHPRWSRRHCEGKLLVTSSFTCSAFDLVDGIQFVGHSSFADSDIEVVMKRGEGVYVVIKRRFLRTSSGTIWEFTIEDRVDSEVSMEGQRTTVSNMLSVR